MNAENLPDPAKFYKIFGDSHCSTMNIALKKSRATNAHSFPAIRSVHMLASAAEFYKPFHRRVGQDVFLTSDLMLSRATGLCTKDGVIQRLPSEVLLISAGLHTHTVLGRHRWSSHRHWKTRPTGARDVVTDGVFTSIVLALHQNIMAFLRDLKDCDHRVQVISAPPPTSRFHLLDIGYTPEDVLFLDKRVRQIMSDAISALGIEIIAYPPNSLAEDGFLREDFLLSDLNDPHHANVDYSESLLQILSPTTTNA